MEPTVPDVKSQRRILLVVWFGFVWALAIYGIVMTVIRPQPSDAGIFRFVLLATGGLTAAAAVYLRVVLIGGLLSKATPLSAAEWNRLRTLYILCFALSEGVALYGLELYFMAGTLSEAWPFFAAGFLLLLICFPRLPA